jgi:hypothetical protein
MYTTQELGSCAIFHAGIATILTAVCIGNYDARSTIIAIITGVTLLIFAVL